MQRFKCSIDAAFHWLWHQGFRRFPVLVSNVRLQPVSLTEHQAVASLSPSGLALGVGTWLTNFRQGVLIFAAIKPAFPRGVMWKPGRGSVTHLASVEKAEKMEAT